MTLKFDIKGISPSSSSGAPSGIISITKNGIVDVSNYAKANVNVSGGGSIAGITREISSNGVFQFPSESFTFSLPNDVTDIGDHALYCAFNSCTSLTAVDLSNLTTISGYDSMYYAFYGCTNLTSVDLSNLTTINGDSAMYYSFRDCTHLKNIDFSRLTKVSHKYSMNGIFWNCTNLTNIYFNNLTTVLDYSMPYAFRNCINLKELRFPVLTLFGSNTDQFQNMLYGVTGCTVHFPANIEDTIGGWSDVINGFGGTNTTVLFDL